MTLRFADVRSFFAREVEVTDGSFYGAVRQTVSTGAPLRHMPRPLKPKCPASELRRGRTNPARYALAGSGRLWRLWVGASVCLDEARRVSDVYHP